MHNHNSDRSLATRRCASCRSRFVFARTDGVLSRRCANTGLSFVRCSHNKQARDTLTSQRGVASRCLRNHTTTRRQRTRRAPRKHTSHWQRATRPNVLTFNSVDACDAAARTQRGASSRSQVGAASGGDGARQLHCIARTNTNRIDAHAQPFITDRKTITVTIMPQTDVASQSRAASSSVVRVDKFNKREFVIRTAPS